MNTIGGILQPLVELGMKNGYLTYSQVGDYLPDDVVDDDRVLKEFLALLDIHRIDLVNESEVAQREAAKAEQEAVKRSMLAALNRAQEMLSRIRHCREIPELDRLKNVHLRFDCGHVYLLQRINGAHHKIGSTGRKISRRIQEIFQKDRIRYRVIEKYPVVCAYKLERELHRHFGRFRIRRKGERKKGERDYQPGEKFKLPIGEVTSFRETVAKLEKWVMHAEEARLELEIIRIEAAIKCM